MKNRPTMRNRRVRETASTLDDRTSDGVIALSLGGPYRTPECTPEEVTASSLRRPRVALAVAMLVVVTTALHGGEALEQLESDDELASSERLELVLEAVEETPHVPDALEIIRTHGEPLVGREAARLRATEAELLALRGDLEAAASAYADAAAAAGDGGDGDGGDGDGAAARDGGDGRTDLGLATTYLFEEAVLRLELGENESARTRAARVVAEARDPRLQRRAALLEARALAATDRLEEALELAELLAEADHAPTVLPETLLFIHRVAGRLEREDRARRALNRLSVLYPDSPEAMISRSTGTGAADTVSPTDSEEVLGVSEMPRPSLLLGAGSTAFVTSPAPAGEEDSDSETDAILDNEATPSGDTPSAAPQDDEDGKDTVDEQTSGHSGASGVQVGSFRGEDNARDMRREMERIGFDAEIRKGPDGRFHRVIIPVAEATEAQELLVRLKEQGFEGFLLFDEEE